MKSNIHPEVNELTAHCTGCGADFKVESTSKEIRVSLCSKCHPIFTGKQKFVDTAGRIEKFRRKYDKNKKK